MRAGLNACQYARKPATLRVLHSLTLCQGRPTTMLTTTELRGLTSSQAWTMSHIRRCQCGMWVVMTRASLKPGYVHPALCAHLTPKDAR